MKNGGVWLDLATSPTGLYRGAVETAHSCRSTLLFLLLRSFRIAVLRRYATNKAVQRFAAELKRTRIDDSQYPNNECLVITETLAHRIPEQGSGTSFGYLQMPLEMIILLTR